MADKDVNAAGTAPDDDRLRKERRAFLTQAGRFAAVTPPAIVMMLSVTDKAKAQTLSNPPTPG